MGDIRDVVIEGRMSSKDLATCVKYLVSVGTVPRSNSDMLDLIVKMAAYATHDAEPFETITEARQYLAGFDLGNLNRSERGKRLAVRTMQEESLTAEGFDPGYAHKRMTIKDVPQTDEDWKRMAEQAMRMSDGVAAVDKPSMMTDEVLESIKQSKRTLIDKTE
jgi:hypothetical protein